MVNNTNISSNVINDPQKTKWNNTENMENGYSASNYSENPEITKINKRIEKINKQKKYREKQPPLFVEHPIIKSVYDVDANANANAEKCPPVKKNKGKKIRFQFPTPIRTPEEDIGPTEQMFNEHIVEGMTQNQVTDTLNYILNEILYVLLFVPTAIGENMHSIFYDLCKKVNENQAVNRLLFKSVPVSDDTLHKDAEFLSIVFWSIIIFWLFTIRITKNWYFLICLVDKKTNERFSANKRIDFSKVLTTKIEGVSDLFQFLFGFVFNVLYLFDKFIFGDEAWSVATLMNKYIRYSDEKSLNNIKRAILLFFALLFVKYTNPLFLVDLLKGKISEFGKFEAQNIILYIISIIILFHFFFRVVGVITAKHEVSTVNRIMVTIGRIMRPLFTIFFLIFYIIFLAIIGILSINASLCMIIVIIWIYSLFAVTICLSNKDTGIVFPLSTKEKEIFEQVEDDYENDLRTTCGDCYQTPFQKFICAFIRIIRNNINMIAFVILLILLTYETWISINLKSLKFIVLFFLILCVFGFSSITIKNIIDLFDKNKKTDNETKTGSASATPSPSYPKKNMKGASNVGSPIPNNVSVGSPSSASVPVVSSVGFSPSNVDTSSVGFSSSDVDTSSVGSPPSNDVSAGSPSPPPINVSQ